jgi:hypothetical protein
LVSNFNKGGIDDIQELITTTQQTTNQKQEKQMKKNNLPQFDKQARQGDVFVERVKSIPEGAKKLQAVDGRYILAAGEVTGHHHAIEAVPGVSAYELNGKIYLHIDEEVTLGHEEHGHFTFAPGEVVESYIQKEYVQGFTRNVAD